MYKFANYLADIIELLGAILVLQQSRRTVSVHCNAVFGSQSWLARCPQGFDCQLVDGAPPGHVVAVVVHAGRPVQPWCGFGIFKCWGWQNW